MSKTYWGTRQGRIHKEDGVMNTLSATGHNSGSNQLIQLNKGMKNGEPMFTLTSQDKHGVYDGMSVRRLTPVECERLQGFPDQWTKYGKDDELISDTQRYKCCGNAVTTNVITAIVDEMFD